MWTTALGGAIGATVCTPPYLFWRAGLLMLGSKALLIPGIVLVVLGVTLHAGATGAVRAIKMSATLVGRGAAGMPPARGSAVEASQEGRGSGSPSPTGGAG